MMKNKMNKKAESGQQVMVFAFLFLLVLIGMGIVGGVVVYYGKGADFRKIDSEILNYRIRECLSESINLQQFKENFSSLCSLNKTVLEDKGFTIKVCQDLSPEECANSKESIFELGNTHIQACFINAAENNPEYVKCTKTEFFDKGEKFSIITGSNQRIAKVNT